VHSTSSVWYFKRVDWFMWVLGWTSGSDVRKGLIMSESGLPGRDTHRVFSVLSFTAGDGFRCFDVSWPRKAVAIVVGVGGTLV